jgi:2-dehydro-3-deoxyphosphogluconate aldolase / (4S)-4-hydroxy-2-oxoglutarate aldolase
VVNETPSQVRVAVPPKIVEGGVIAIGRGLDPRTVVRIGEGLAAGGVGAFEITVGGTGALESIAALRDRFGDDGLLIGAGTVLGVADAERAIAAGASFLVSPITDPVLVAWAAAHGVPAFPGAMTPTEALAGWAAGAAAIKLFPASVTGPAFIRELHGPFPEIPIVPTGGVTIDTAPGLIVAGAVAVGIGTWLTGDGDPAGIAQRGRRMVAVIRAVRESGRAE